MKLTPELTSQTLQAIAETEQRLAAVRLSPAHRATGLIAVYERRIALLKGALAAGEIDLSHKATA